MKLIDFFVGDNYIKYLNYNNLEIIKKWKDLRLMKKLFSLFLVAAMAISLVGCSSGTETEETTEGMTTTETTAIVSEDNDFVVAFQADATGLNPHKDSNGVSNSIINNMYEALVTFDQDSNIIAMLASEWTVSEDALTYTFKLQEGVTFHDGEVFNAQAIVDNYEYIILDETLSAYRQVSNWESIEVLGDYEIAITLITANNTFLNKLTQLRIISPAVLATEDPGSALNDMSYGTGPFKFEGDRIEGGHTTMVPNTEYWREGPKVDSLTFKVVPEDGSRMAMLQTGEADLINPLPAIQATELESDPSIIVNNTKGITYRYATLNQNYTLEDGRQPFADVRVRQAMNYAFDSLAYAQVVFNGFASEPTSIFSDQIMYHSEMTPYSIDLDKAASLMEEAGYADGFPVDIWVDNTTVEMAGAEFFKQQMSEINIDVNVMPMESATIASMVQQPVEETEVEIWYVNWGSGSYEADGSMRSILHSDSFPVGRYNTAYYSNPEFDRLLDEALVSNDTAEIADLYAQAQAIAWEECPWVFLGNDNNLSAQKTYVAGLQYKPAGEVVYRTVELVQE